MEDWRCSFFFDYLNASRSFGCRYSRSSCAENSRHTSPYLGAIFKLSWLTKMEDDICNYRNLFVSEPALLCWSHPIQMWLHLSLWLSREYFKKFVLPIYQPFPSPLLMGFGRLCCNHKSIGILLQAKLFPTYLFLFNNTCTFLGIEGIFFLWFKAPTNLTCV